MQYIFSFLAFMSVLFAGGYALLLENDNLMLAVCAAMLIVSLTIMRITRE